MGRLRDIQRRLLQQNQTPPTAAEERIKEALTKDITKTLAGKPESFLEKQRTNLNNTWKKIESRKRKYPVTVSMFCDKGKHDRCTFDPDCTCECHADLSKPAIPQITEP